MDRIPTTRTVAALAALVALGAPAARAQGTWALTNARIETVTRGVIERGTIVIRDGLIAAVGAGVEVPAGARVLDLGGKTVLPGFIDLTSTLGLPRPQQPGGGPGGGFAAAAAAAAAGQQSGPVGLEPERLVAEEFRPDLAEVRGAREAGITAVLIAPGRGAFRGQSALVPTRDSVAATHVLRSPVALHMGFEGTPGRYPATLLGVLAYERQALYDAQRHALLQERYRQNPRGVERPAHDPRLAALVPVVRGEMPVFFAADGENQIKRALSIGREFNLNLAIVGATEGFRAAEALAASRRPVVVTLDFPRSTQVTGWQLRGSLRRPLNDSAVTDSAVQRLLEGNAAALNRAGVRFALASGSLRPSEFVANVRKAVAAGLPRDTALAALTIRPAQLAGADRQLGSIEEGKVANLVVTEGDLLAGDSGRVRMVFVDGIRYEVAAPPPAAAGRGGPGGRPGRGAAVPVAELAGTWDVTVSTPQGEQQVTMTVTQSGASFSGSMTSQMGVTEIAGGSVEGRRATWSITVPTGGENVVVSFNAEATGNRMSGTGSFGEMGSFTFRGEKRP